MKLRGLSKSSIFFNILKRALYMVPLSVGKNNFFVISRINMEPTHIFEEESSILTSIENKEFVTSRN
jgi:hypothetical protein